jgi:LmbE family N-acetylglucosaminyl deacetylase
VLVVAAHPDDEVIGASFVLTHAKDAYVLHVTDGAPADPGLWSPLAPPSRSGYAALRRAESLEALALAGLPSGRVHSLGFADQELCACLPALIARMRAAIATIAPDVVVVHPYEGGHPDHDATALAVHVAVGAFGPPLVEMTSYHRRDGALRTGAFLPLPIPVVERAAPPQKRAMLDRFASQAGVLAPFRAGRELYRRAPPYEFRLPPHPGTLHYETLGWPMTGARFRALAAEALQAGVSGARPC